ncbi:MAG: hypothetical protein GXY39_06705 [Actinomycetales bacterium]|nr:hypothetical protein [Actinomycetales bacterium]
MSDRTDGARRPQEVIRHLERLLDREHQRLEVRRGELSEVREAVRAMAPLLSSPLTVPRADLEIVPAEAAADVIGQLLDDSDGGVIRNVTRTVDYGPGLEEERIRDMQQRLADGLVMRSIYPLSVLDTAAGRRWIAAWADAGEEQRFVSDPPSEFLVIGTSTVLACAEWNVPESDYLVIRDPMLVQVFIALHEATYSAAVALSPDNGDLPAGEARLIDLMALGLKDEAIARTLGISLRTIRRRIADLMAEHGVETRFQLGAALHARGRLEAGPVPLSTLRARSESISRR